MTGISPYMLCGNMLGKRVTVTKKDGGTFTGVLKSYTINVRLEQDWVYTSVHMCTPNGEPKPVLGDSTIMLGETRVRLTDSDTITVEDIE